MLCDISTKQNVNSITSQLSFRYNDSVYLILWLRGMKNTRVDLMVVKDIFEQFNLLLDGDSFELRNKFYDVVKVYGNIITANSYSEILNVLLERKFTEEEVTYIRMLIDKINSESE